MNFLIKYLKNLQQHKEMKKHVNFGKKQKYLDNMHLLIQLKKLKKKHNQFLIDI